MKVQARNEQILKIAAGGVLIALSVVLGLIRVYKMPMGGSVTLASMMPLVFGGLIFGPVWGLVIAMVRSVLDLLIDGVSLPSAWVLLLDYLLAFGVVGFLPGFFAHPDRGSRPLLGRIALVSHPKLILATVLALLGRFVFSFMSGVLLYGQYAPEGMSPVWYSFAYNMTYILPEMLLTLVVLFLMKAALTRAARKL